MSDPEVTDPEYDAGYQDGHEAGEQAGFERGVQAERARVLAEIEDRVLRRNSIELSLLGDWLEEATDG